MNIAITGDNGFLGRMFQQKLASQNIRFSGFNRKKYSLFKSETLKDFVVGKDAIIHLAGANKDKGLEDIIRVNVLGTKGLLDAVHMYSPSAKIIFASSFMVYLKDDFFGVSKKIAEDLITEHTKEYSSKAIILRFSNIYGESAKPFHNSAISTFVHKIKKDDQILINGDGTQRRDYLHLDDAINAMLKAIQYEPSGIEYFDICSGKLISINEVLAFLEKASHKKLNVCYNKKIKSDDLRLEKNYEYAKKALGWQPTIQIEEGLKLFFTSRV